MVLILTSVDVEHQLVVCLAVHVDQCSSITSKSIVYFALKTKLIICTSSGPKSYKMKFVYSTAVSSFRAKEL